MNLEIIKVPNPILKQKAKKVGLIDKSTKKLISDMVETLRKEGGMGLAANQVGKIVRIIVIEARRQQKGKEKQPLIPLTILINPEIINTSPEKEVDIEGCLSIPNIWGEVPRYKWINLKALNGEGKKIKIKARGLFARVLQHEIDHLDGILFTERVKDLSTLHSLDKDGQKIPINLVKL